MSGKEYIFKVELACSGCSNVLQNVLNRHKDKGIQDYSIDLEGQTVKISTASLTPEELLEIVKKSGKKADLMAEG